MATVALGAAFKAIAAAGTATAATGGPAFVAATTAGATGAASGWAAVGALAGMYIDSAFVLPRLFKGPDTTEAKGIGITGLDEGDPHKHAIGPYNRVPGFLYWQPLRPRFVEGEQGGKGGGMSKSGGRPDKYYSDGVYALTRTAFGEDELGNTDRKAASTALSMVWMDGKIKFLGGQATTATSTGYELYESVENTGGNVSLIYTIQTTTTEPPGGESVSDWTLVNKFRAGEPIDVRNSGESPTMGQSFLDDPEDYDRKLYPVGSGYLPDGGSYVQLEWRYWEDEHVFRAISTIAGMFTPYYNTDFYTGAPTYVDANGDEYVREGYSGGKVPFADFLSGYWDAPLGTDPVDPSGVVQDRGFLASASKSGSSLVVRQQDRAIDKSLVSNMFIRSGEESSGIGVLEAEEGAGQPRLSGFSALVIDNLDLFDFGSRMPNVECLVAQDRDPVPLSEAIIRICCYHNDLQRDQVDVTALEGESDTIQGYWWASPFGLNILQPLIVAYDLSVLEYEGKLTFRKREAATTHTIPSSDLGVTQGVDADVQLSVTEDAESDVVLTTSVRYTDPGANYSVSEQNFTRPDISTGRTVNIDLTNLVLSAAKAREIAQRSTWQSIMYRQEVRFVLGPKWGHIVAGDRVYLSDVLDQDWQIMLTNVTRGEDGRMSCEGFRDYGLATRMPTLDADASGSSLGSSAFYVPPTMAAEALDIGPLSLEDYNTPGLYLAAAAKYYGADYRGSEWKVAYGSQETTTNFFTGETTTTTPSYENLSVSPAIESPMGVLLEVLPSGQADVVNDLGNGFLVRMYHEDLESVADIQDMYERRQLLWVGGEVIAFELAAIEEDLQYGYDNAYRVSGRALRGLYNTEHLIAEHPVGTPCVLIDRQTLRRAPVPVANVDSTEIRYQNVPTGDEQGGFNAELSVTVLNEGGSGLNIGANKRPFPVGHIRAFAEDPASNLISWTAPQFYEDGQEVFLYDNTGGRTVYECTNTHYNATLTDNARPGTTTGGGYWTPVTPERDYRIRWNYRTAIPVATLPSSTAETKRETVKFSLTVFNGSTAVRTVTDLEDTEFLYTHEMMVEDGININDFDVEVRADNIHMSSEVTRATLPGYE